jgi:simple sugar transport system permease protein
VRGLLETLTITIAAIAVSLVLFALLMLAHKGINPLELVTGIAEGGFGTKRSWMNTLAKAAPLLLTALCTALPARLGLVIIGGEGALIAGGLAAAIVGPALAGMPFPVPQIAMILSGMMLGALLIAFAGGLRHWRGVNATICSLLLTYIMLYVFNYLIEGPLLFSKTSNKFSSAPIPPNALIGKMTGLDVHWGLLYGVIACVLAYILMDHTTFGFAARMAGGNVRAAQGAGLPVGRLILITCLLGGAAAGLAGVVEVAAVHKQGNSGLYAAGFGYTGILVSFIARHHPLGIIPAAILFGGVKSSSDELQMSFGLPDASVDVFAGIVFVMILLSETFYGRIRLFQPPDVTKKVEPPKDDASITGTKTAVASAS